MKYKTLFIIFTIIIIAIPLAIIIKNHIDNNVITKGKYEIFISKNANSSIEKIASATAEKIDYSSIFWVERYYLSLQGMNSYQCYSNNMSFNEKTYVWANFIDDIGLDTFDKFFKSQIFIIPSSSPEKSKASCSEQAILLIE